MAYLAQLQTNKVENLSAGTFFAPEVMTQFTVRAEVTSVHGGGRNLVPQFLIVLIPMTRYCLFPDGSVAS